MLSRRSAITLTLTSLAAIAALIAATILIAQTWLTPTQEQRNRAAPGQNPAVLVVTKPAPVHAEPSMSSQRLAMITEPDCSTIGAVAGDTMAERAVDEDGNIWFSTAPDTWVLNNGFCH